MECKFCKGKCQKAGKQSNGTQKYYCKSCKKYQQDIYKYMACNKEIVNMIPRLVCESVGVRGIARILRISLVTVLRKIEQAASLIVKPPIPINKESFEMDELRTFVRKKENQFWVVYALCGETKKVVDFTVGKRSKRTLRTVVNTLLLSGVKTIKTDKLNIYQSLIPCARNVSAAYNINYIERNNLNLRTHLKRLSRKTICFSKSLAILEACLKIYFWSNHRQVGKRIFCNAQ